MRERNCRSLHCAPPDSLLKLVGSASFMRLSLRKAAHVALSTAARQEMTKGGLVEGLVICDKETKLQIPPLRCAAVGMTKGALLVGLMICDEETEPQIPPLRYASVGMTKGALLVDLMISGGDTGTADPLRFASVRMTKGALLVGLMICDEETGTADLHCATPDFL